MSCCGSVRRRGVALIWVTLVMFSVILLCGLAMDVSITVYSKQQLQNAADAAALAGAALVHTDTQAARMQAQRIAAANIANTQPVALELEDAIGEIVIGRYNKETAVFSPGSELPNAMRVLARRTSDSHGPIPLSFGSILNVDTVNVQAEAIAMVKLNGGLIVLDPAVECAASFNGNVSVTVTDFSVDPPEPGNINVNSDAYPAVCADGRPSLRCNELSVSGGADPGGMEHGDCTIETDAPPIDDPLAGLPAVEWKKMSVVPVYDAPVAFAPGYHKATAAITKNTITLLPGIHVFDSGSTDPKKPGDAFLVSGNGGVRCDGGVLLYIERGSLTLKGGGGVDLDSLNAPAAPDSTYNGITIFQARYNNSPATLEGNSALNLTGTLYFPNNKLDLSGTDNLCGNQLIVGTLEVSGTSDITIDYTGGFPAPGGHSYLVR